MIFGTHFLVWLNLLIGIALLIYGITLLVREKHRCVQEVEAVCISVRRVKSTDTNWADVYNPILEYEWQEKNTRSKTTARATLIPISSVKPARS